ncbi:MAG TPA: NUDIX hydrolase [Candidatus Dormibacteraeota bacterium]|jgi:8-oxo-dGTP diphosphatase|nr:NUDIX hydrolase [Candidatus Dormibacteraeota bacterium]
MPPARKEPARHAVSAGGVVFRHAPAQIEFALIKAGGRWSFPKGNIERGEAPPVAALREISEETGLPLQRLRIIDQLPEVEYVFRWTGVLVFKTVHYYLVQLTGDAPFQPQLSEIEEVRWFTAAAARRAISFKNAKETLEAAIARLDAWRLAS